MDLYGWKYEGRKISEQLQEQILAIVEFLNDPVQVGEEKWPSIQKRLATELGIATGQIRTIKRMMEELDIIKKDSLNATDVPNSDIYTENGRTFLNLIAAEKLMRDNPDHRDNETLHDINEIYRLYYQKVLLAYTYTEGPNRMHPLLVTLKAIKRHTYLDYWEWYLLNTVIHNDDDQAENDQLDEYIRQYRNGTLTFSEDDIKENKLAHSYVLGNFKATGLINVEGSKASLRITFNPDNLQTIRKILGEEEAQNA